MRKTLYTLISAMSLGLASCSDNNPANKFVEALQGGSRSTSIDDKIKEKKEETKADNLEKRVEEKKEEAKIVEKEKEAKEQQKREYRVYSKEELAFIDQKIAEYKKTFESAGYRDRALEWLNVALDEAKDGKLWRNIKSSIEIAKGKRGYVEDALCNPEEIIREVHKNLIRTEGPKHVREYLDKAKESAKSGELWYDVKWNLDMAEEYVKEAGIELDEKEKRDVKEVYMRGIKENGPKKAAKYLREAADELEKYGSLSYIQWRLDSAREYAKEAGFELIAEEK